MTTSMVEAAMPRRRLILAAIGSHILLRLAGARIRQRSRNRRVRVAYLDIVQNAAHALNISRDRLRLLALRIRLYLAGQRHLPLRGGRGDLLTLQGRIVRQSIGYVGLNVGIALRRRRLVTRIFSGASHPASAFRWRRLFAYMNLTRHFGAATDTCVAP